MKLAGVEARENLHFPMSIAAREMERKEARKDIGREMGTSEGRGPTGVEAARQQGWRGEHGTRGPTQAPLAELRDRLAGSPEKAVRGDA